MKVDRELLAHLISQPRTVAAERRLVTSFRQTQAKMWFDIFEQSAGLTVLALPKRTTFTTAVRSPFHDTNSAIAHIFPFQEYTTVATAVAAGLETVASHPSFHQVSSVLAALITAIDHEMGINLFRTRKDWFQLSENEQEAYFRLILREGLRVRDAN